jgi:hypothetical protein
MEYHEEEDQKVARKRERLNAMQAQNKARAE